MTSEHAQDKPPLDLQFKVGDTVEKRSGYKWPGVIVAEFITLAGKKRYVVECTASGVTGALHIFRGSQLLERDVSSDCGPGISIEAAAKFEAEEHNA